MSIITLTQTNFDEVVEQNNLLVIDFWAQWCAPCLSFGSVIEAADQKHLDVTFAKVDIETEVELAEEFNVRSVPWVMILREQVAVYDDSGALTATALDELIEQAKSLDMSQVREG